MMKTQTANGVNCLYQFGQRHFYPVTDYRDEQAEEAAVSSGIEMRRAREAA